MKIYQSRSFENKIKRFSKKEKNILDQEIKKIIEDPSFGEEKKGDSCERYIFINLKSKLFSILFSIEQLMTL